MGYRSIFTANYIGPCIGLRIVLRGGNVWTGLGQGKGEKSGRHSKQSDYQTRRPWLDLSQYRVLEEHESKGQNHEGPCFHAKEFWFYPEDNEKLLKDYKQDRDMTRFMI